MKERKKERKKEIKEGKQLKNCNDAKGLFLKKRVKNKYDYLKQLSV